MSQLYGDGIHDDTSAIQEMLRITQGRRSEYGREIRGCISRLSDALLQDRAALYSKSADGGIDPPAVDEIAMRWNLPSERY